MNEHKILELKVGITIFAGLIILMISIIWLKGITFKPNTYNVRIVFDNTAGLMVGDPVNVSGVRVGKVMDIDLEGDSVVTIVSISNSVRLKKDAAAIISSVDFFGAKKIEMLLGSGREDFDLATRMKGTREPDLSELTTQFRDLGTDVKITLKYIDSLLISTNAIVGDKSFAQSLKKIASNLDSTSSKLKTIVAKSDTKFDSTYIRLTQTLRGLRALVEKTDTRFDTTFTDVRQITGQVLKVTKQMDSIFADIRQGEGNLGKMIYDESLYTKMDHTIAQLDSLVALVRKKGMRVDVKLFGD